MQAEIAALSATMDAQRDRIAAVEKDVKIIDGRMYQFIFLLIGCLISSLGSFAGIIVMLLRTQAGK